MAEPDENTLVAYVDGELDAATAREVEQALESSPAARNMVAKLRSSAALVRAAFADAVHEPMPPGLVELLRTAKPQPSPRRYALPLAASIALLIGIGAGIGIASLGGRTVGRAASDGLMNRMVDEVAEYHRLYSREQRHMVEVSAAETPHIEDWLGRRLKGQLQIPNLTSQGFTFKGGRLLMFDARPMAELVYAPADGPPIGLCIAFAQPGMTGAATEQRGDLTIDHWVDNGYVYSVVGWTNDRQMHAIVDSVRAQLHL
jgi:anti-sigma factor RsiW